MKTLVKMWASAFVLMLVFSLPVQGKEVADIPQPKKTLTITVSEEFYKNVVKHVLNRHDSQTVKDLIEEVNQMVKGYMDDNLDGDCNVLLPWIF
jgi:hypothetical protein